MILQSMKKYDYEQMVFCQDRESGFKAIIVGGVINDETIPQLKAKVIAEAANNQLKEEYHGDLVAVSARYKRCRSKKLLWPGESGGGYDRGNIYRQ